MNKVPLGEHHGMLTLVSILPPRGSGRLRVGIWLCECGNQKQLPNSRVINGYVRSCGCLRKITKPGLTHGKRKTPAYSSWIAMKSRCLNKKHKDYPRYGAVGVTLCERWLSFENFLADMGPRPKGTSIDRIDGTRGYEPSNCRWATDLEQARNKKSIVIINTPVGRMPLCDYAKVIGISRGAAHLRLKRGKFYGCYQ